MGDVGAFQPNCECCDSVACSLDVGPDYLTATWDITISGFADGQGGCTPIDHWNRTWDGIPFFSLGGGTYEYRKTFDGTILFRLLLITGGDTAQIFISEGSNNAGLMCTTVPPLTWRAINFFGCNPGFGQPWVVTEVIRHDA